MDPNQRRLGAMARGFAQLAAPPAPMDLDAPIDLDPPIEIEDPDGPIRGADRYVTRVLQRLVQRPALNGQVVRVDLNSWNGTTYRVRAGGEALRVLPGHLRELREDDAAIRVQDQGRAVSQARVDYERARLERRPAVLPAEDEVAKRPKKVDGAVVTGLTQKETDVGENVVTLKDSTWQVDILDWSRQDAPYGYALVAVDVANRQVYGELMADKSSREARDAFARMIGEEDDDPKMANEPGVPNMVDTDHDAAFRGAFQVFLQQKGISHRMKTDAMYSHNNLAQVDRVMGLIRRYIRGRLVADARPGGADNVQDWPDYFDDAIQAQNDRRSSALSDMRPTDLYDEDGKPEETEEAQATLFKIEKEMAAGFHKNKEKQDRKKSELDRTQAFRVPISVGRQPTRFSYRITQNNLSGEVHRIDPVATAALNNLSRVRGRHNEDQAGVVVSVLDGRSWPISVIEPVEQGSRDVTIPERLQRNPVRKRQEMEGKLMPYREEGRRLLQAKTSAGAQVYEGTRIATDVGEMSVEAFGDSIVAHVPPGTFQAFRALLATVGIRAGDAVRLYVKFIEFWKGYFLLRERKRLVRLRAEPADEADTDDDKQLPSAASGTAPPPAPPKSAGPTIVRAPVAPRALPGAGRSQEDQALEAFVRATLGGSDAELLALITDLTNIAPAAGPGSMMVLTYNNDTVTSQHLLSFIHRMQDLVRAERAKRRRARAAGAPPGPARPKGPPGPPPAGPAVPISKTAAKATSAGSAAPKAKATGAPAGPPSKASAKAVPKQSPKAPVPTPPDATQAQMDALRERVQEVIANNTTQLFLMRQELRNLPFALPHAFLADLLEQLQQEARRRRDLREAERKAEEERRAAAQAREAERQRAMARETEKERKKRRRLTEAAKSDFQGLLNRFAKWKDENDMPANKADRNILNMLHHGWDDSATFRYWYIINRALRRLGRRRGMAMLRVTPEDMKAAIEAEMKKEGVQTKNMSDYSPSKIAEALRRWQEWYEPDEEPSSTDSDVDDPHPDEPPEP